MSKVRNGRDADEKKILKKVLKKIKFPEQIIPDSSEQLRNKLELLEGEERLDISAIEGLKEILEELKSRPLGGGGGGFSYIAMKQHIVDGETPSGAINGTNKVFTLASAPNPVNSLKVYVNGQRMKSGGEDFTLSGVTITFVTALPTGSILLVDYMK